LRESKSTMKRCHSFGAPPRYCDGPGLKKKAPRFSELDVAPTPARKSLLLRAAGEGPISNAEGMARAYEQGDAYAHGDMVYIAGSHTARDWWDDVTKIPFWGDSHKIYRLQMAQKALKANPQATTVVGHSLGGSVALQLQKDNPRLKSVTYGAPVLDVFGGDRRDYDMARLRGGPGPEKPERYRNVLDPVSFFDASAVSDVPGLKDFFTFSGPHSYGTLAQQHHSTGIAATQNQDGSVSISE